MKTGTQIHHTTILDDHHEFDGQDWLDILNDVHRLAHRFPKSHTTCIEIEGLVIWVVYSGSKRGLTQAVADELDLNS